MTPVPRGKCAVCGELLELRDGAIPYHNYPKPTRALCRGSNALPRTADARATTDGADGAES